MLLIALSQQFGLASLALPLAVSFVTLLVACVVLLKDLRKNNKTQPPSHYIRRRVTDAATQE